MAKGIVLDGAKNTRIEDSEFVDLDIAVEAKNSEGLQLSRNKVIQRRRIGRPDKQRRE